MKKTGGRKSRDTIPLTKFWLVPAFRICTGPTIINFYFFIILLLSFLPDLDSNQIILEKFQIRIRNTALGNLNRVKISPMTVPIFGSVCLSRMQTGPLFVLPMKFFGAKIKKWTQNKHNCGF